MKARTSSRFGLLLSLLTGLFLYSCQTDDLTDTRPIVQSEVAIVSSESIPEIISVLNNALNLSMSNDGSGANLASSDIGVVDLNNIMQVIDTLQSKNYTFLIEDSDNDPFTFSNLIIKKRASGTIDYPYLLEYVVDSARRQQFALAGFAMDQFTGTVKKRYLDSSIGAGNTLSQANLDVRSEMTPGGGECDRDFEYESGSNYPGGSTIDDDPPLNDFGGGGGTLICWDVLEPVGTCKTETSSATGAPVPVDANYEGCKLKYGEDSWVQNGSVYLLRRRCAYITSSAVADDSMCPLNEPEDLGVISNSYEDYLENPPVLSSSAELRNYLIIAAAEFSKYDDTQEASVSLHELSSLPFTRTELMELASRAGNVYQKLKSTGFSVDKLNTFNQKQVATDLIFLDIYPEIRAVISDSNWPLTREEWEALWEIFKPMIAEVLLESVPIGGITIAFRDIIEGSQNNDVIAVSAGLVSLIVEFFPPAKAAKASLRIGKIIRKAFKFVKYGRKYLRSIGKALKAGLTVDLDGALIKISKNGDEIGTIKNGNLVPKKYGSSGSPVGDPDGGYQLYKNGDNYHYKRTPDVSGYSSSDLNKLTSHPDAHTLERHGHDVSDDALIKRANTGIAPDGSPYGVLNPTPPPYSSRFDSPDLLMDAYNSTKPGTSAFNTTTATHGGTRKRVVIPAGSKKYGVGVASGSNVLEDMRGIVANYENIGGEWKLVSMFPNK